MCRLIDLYLTVFHFWMRFPEKVRYVLVGGYNTVVSYALYALFLYLLKNDHPQYALFLSFSVSSLNSYWTQKIYVFGTKGNCLKEYARCLLAWGVSYVLNAVLLEGFLMLGFTPLVAQLMALMFIVINSYLMLKYIAFQNHKRKENK